MKRSIFFILAVCLAGLASAALLWGRGETAPEPAGKGLDIVLQDDDLPMYNWFVCADLGVGPVPGIPGERARFHLCHNDGWLLQAYCLQPNWPAPEIGTVCTRISAGTYWCGNGIQNLQTYGVLQTPTPAATLTPTNTATQTPTQTATYTPTSTASSTPTNTSSPTPSATPTQTATSTATVPSRTPQTPTPTATGRPGPGGPRLVDLLAFWRGAAHSASTATPFQPQAPTPSAEAPTPAAPVQPAPSYNFYGIDFARHDLRVRMRIYPNTRRVNNGKPITIAFKPGVKCRFGDGRACVYAYPGESLGELIALSVHSGIGGEGQALRRALEGSGLFGAGLPLSQIQERLEALDGAAVTIEQGDVLVEGLELAVISRLAPKHLATYLADAFPQALAYAAEFDPELAGLLDPAEPQLVFETCGWRVRGEPGANQADPSSASIYLGLIRLRR